MNKPTREEVERWIETCEGGVLHQEDIGRYTIAWQKSLCQSYLALLDEYEHLKAELVEERRFCICGCSVSEHENYGDEGLGCDNPQHECVLVCAAAASIADELHKEIERLKAEHSKIYGNWERCCNEVVLLKKQIEQMQSEVEMADMIGSAWHKDVKELDELRKVTKRQAAVIEAAQEYTKPNYDTRKQIASYNRLLEALTKLKEK